MNTLGIFVCIFGVFRIVEGTHVLECYKGSIVLPGSDDIRHPYARDVSSPHRTICTCNESCFVSRDIAGVELYGCTSIKRKQNCFYQSYSKICFCNSNLCNEHFPLQTVDDRFGGESYSMNHEVGRHHTESTLPSETGGYRLNNDGHSENPEEGRSFSKLVPKRSIITDIKEKTPSDSQTIIIFGGRRTNSTRVKGKRLTCFDGDNPSHFGRVSCKGSCYISVESPSQRRIAGCSSFPWRNGCFESHYKHICFCNLSYCNN